MADDENDAKCKGVASGPLRYNSFFQDVGVFGGHDVQHPAPRTAHVCVRCDGAVLHRDRVSCMFLS